MKKLIKASAGDVQLRKFVFVPMDYVEGVEDEAWSFKLGGYLFIWDYTYNTITHETDDRMWSHAAAIAAMEPEVRRQARELNVWGKTDWYKDQIRFVIVNADYIPKQTAKLIQEMVLRR